MQEIINEIIKIMEKNKLTLLQAKYVLSATMRELDKNSIVKKSD